MTGTIQDTARAVTLELGAGNLLLETGGGLRHLGPPVMNDAGTLAAWAVTDNNREVILRKVKGQPTQLVAAAGDAGWASFGRPSINANGDLAFWGGTAAGADAILAYSGGTLTTAVQAGSTLPFLYQPEIADDGTMVYLGQTADGRNNVFVRKPGGATTTVAADTSAESLGLDGYDISPDGLVVYNGVTWDAPDVLHLWNGTTASTLFNLTQETGFVRFGPGYVTMRTWDGEIDRLYRVTTAGVATVLARHGDANGFGDFLSSRANASGDVVFEAVHWLTPTSSPGEMGNWLHRCLASVGNPNPVVTRPLDVVDGRTQVDLDFGDAFNASGAIGFTLTLQDSQSAVRQAVIGYNYALP